MAGKDAFGAALLVSNMQSSPTFTEIANVESINGIDAWEVAEHEVTAHDSPDNTREYIPGLIDPATVELGLRWDEDEATHQTLTGLKRQVVDWTIQFASGYESDFEGFITSLSVDAPADGIQEGSVTIRVTGARGTFAEPSSSSS